MDIDDTNINILLPNQELNSILNDQNMFSYFSANPFADISSSSSPLSSPFLPASIEDGFSSPNEPLPSENSSPSSTDEFAFDNLNFLDPVAQQAFLSSPSLLAEMDESKSVKESNENENSSDSEQKPKKRGRKRQRRDPNESLDVSAVQISREVLLKISSQEYDDQLKALSRDLTWAEKKEVKKQRRLIKNRESAQASRQRKKQQFDELESAMNVLKQRNEELETQVSQLKTENFKLHEEISKLYAIIKKTGVQMPANIKKGVVLLAMLFSFGLLFNFANNNNSPFSTPLQTSTLSQVLSAVPASVAKLAEINPTQRNDASMRHILQDDEVSTTRQFKERASSHVQQNDVLQNGEKLQNKPQQNKPRQYGGPLQNKVLQNDQNENLQYGTRRDNIHKQGYAQHKISIREKEETERLQNKRIEFDSQPADASYSNDVMQVDIGTVIEEFTNESTASNLTRLVEERDNETKFYFEQLKVKVRPNTAYFVSSDFHQIKPSNQEPFDQNGQLYISVIVPSSTLNLPIDSVDKFIEINCQVTEINLTPSGQLASPIAVSS